MTHKVEITHHTDHYRATLYPYDWPWLYAEGDTQESARLSLLDRLITEDDGDIHLSGPIVQELIEHANNRARLHIVRSVREAWSAIRHTDNAITVNHEYNSIETAAQIVHGGMEVNCEWVEQWPSLAAVLRNIYYTQPVQSTLRQRLYNLL